jgi:hypothetical protein
LLEISVNELKHYLYKVNLDEGLEEQRASNFAVYQWFIAKEKAIYNALNMMKV